jgi:hypothetical protein
MDAQACLIRMLAVPKKSRNLMWTIKSDFASPRSAKRLIDVFKLLKIIRDRRGLGTDPSDDVKRAMLMLLALSARHPEVMRILLGYLEEEFRGKQTTPCEEKGKPLFNRPMQKRGRGSHPSPGVAAREKSDLHQKNFSG